MVKSEWAVVFDCDGVVVNSEPLGLATLEAVVCRYGLPIRRPELDYYCGHSDKATYDDLVERYGTFATLSEFLSRVEDAYIEAVAQHGLAVFPGIYPLVAALQKNGVPYGIGSSGQRSKLHTSLNTAGLLELFPVVVGGDDVVEAKPAPDIFLTVAHRLGVVPSRCVVIEDSPTGVLAARNAQMFCVGVTTSFPRSVLEKADLIVESLEQLDVETLYNLVAAS